MYCPESWKYNFTLRFQLAMIKGVVSVPVETGSYELFYRIQRHRKPRGTFGKFRLIKAALGTRQPQFIEISWQCGVSPGDRILILISPK